MRHVISAVEEGSMAFEKGLAAGDELLSVNGKKITDVIDYNFLTSGKKARFIFRKPSGELIHIQTDDFEAVGLGAEFENGLMDAQKNCRNKCIFCFIDQLPRGMRKPLYVKDDDWRLSVLVGNFVTFTNITPDDIRRICKYKASPIYISVHSTNPSIREKMMGNAKAAEIMPLLRKLAKSGIRFHSQIVLVPGVNDKEHLEETIEELYTLYPYAASAAVVPVGLTRFRERLCPLRTLTVEEMRETILSIQARQQQFHRESGSSIVYAADEMYLASGEELPRYEEYEDFPQLQNGVGLWRKLEKEFIESFESLEIDPYKREISICTGVLIADKMKELLAPFMIQTGMKVNIYPVRNEYFGEGVTVTGLITGNDIYNQLKDKQLGEELFIPMSMLKNGEPIFLDDMTVNELSIKLNIKIKPVAVEGESLLMALQSKTEE